MTTVRQQKAERGTARDSEERLRHSGVKENSKRKAEGSMQKCEARKWCSRSVLRYTEKILSRTCK